MNVCRANVKKVATQNAVSSIQETGVAKCQAKQRAGLEVTPVTFFVDAVFSFVASLCLFLLGFLQGRGLFAIVGAGKSVAFFSPNLLHFIVQFWGSAGSNTHLYLRVFGSSA